MPRKWLLRCAGKNPKAKMEHSPNKKKAVIIEKKMKPVVFPPTGYRPTVLNTLLAVS